MSIWSAGGPRNPSGGVTRVAEFGLLKFGLVRGIKRVESLFSGSVICLTFFQNWPNVCVGRDGSRQ